MVVNGNVCGVAVFGNVTAEQIRKGIAIVETVATLKRQLAELFDEQTAEAVVARLGVSSATLTQGELPKEVDEQYRFLAELGAIRKAH